MMRRLMLPHRRRNRLLLLAAAALCLLAAGLWFFLPGLRLPWSVRLLPPSSALFYANVAPIRRAASFPTHFEFEENAGYQQFTQDTGIDPRRDLDEIALSTDTPVSGQDRRTSEVFRGRFDHRRLQAWLQLHSDSRASYRGFTVFTILHQGRPVRVVLLNSTSVAVTNTDAADNIHSILDAAHSFHPRGGSAVRMYFRDVPAGSVLWCVARFSPGEQPSVTLGDGTTVAAPIAPDATIIISARYLGAIFVAPYRGNFRPTKRRRAASRACNRSSLLRALSPAVRIPAIPPTLLLKRCCGRSPSNRTEAGCRWKRNCPRT